MPAAERRSRRPRVTVLGAVAMDSRLQSAAPLVPGTSNPVRAVERPGGVGRNMAVTLARLGADVALASRVGGDPAGEALLAGLAAADIDTAHAGCSPRQPTARYWAVIEPSGELAMGLADMAVLDELEAEALAPALARPADAWLFDCNLPAAAIARLRCHPRRPPLLAVDTVSTAKAARLGADLAGIGLLCTNAAEAGVLAGYGPPEALAERLLRLGATRVVIGLGEGGLIAADAMAMTHLAALPVAPRDVTGAGDALAAAVLLGLLRGLGLGAAARLGRLAAAAIIGGTANAYHGVAIADLRALAFRLDKEAHADLACLHP